MPSANFILDDTVHLSGFCRFGSDVGNEEVPMLITISVLLVVMWLLGMVSSYTLGGFLHILLLLAVVTGLIGIVQGRDVL